MKILIIKTGALGDVLRTSFIAQALKDKYKKINLEIFWLTSQPASHFFINKNGEIEYTQETSYWFDMSMISRLGKEKADILKNKNKKTHRQIFSEIIGMDWRKYEPFLRLTDAQRKMAQEFSNKHHLSKSDLIIGINTGAADRWPKELPVKKTIELIENIHK